MSTPLLNHLFLEDINLVELHEDLRHSRDEVGVLDADEALDTAQQRLLVLLARDELMTKSIKV